MIKRLYINLTNKCNRRCPFCFMWSGPANNTFIDDMHIWGIIAEHNDLGEPYEVQLGGGEPLLHPQFLGFVEYCLAQPQITTVKIDTNGVVLDDYLDALYNLAHTYNKQIVLKISVNYSLVAADANYLNKLKKWLPAYPNDNVWLMTLSIRHRTPEDMDKSWLDVLRQNDFFGYPHNYFTIEYTGRAQRLKVGGTVLSKDIAPSKCVPYVYASDGTYFGKDFDARKDYEEKLSNDK